MSRGQLIKLTRILGMLGSDHEGERASAALAAHRFVKRAGVTWWDLLAPRDPRAPSGRQPPSGVERRIVVDPIMDLTRATESRLRQLQRENADLQAEIKRLKRLLSARDQRARTP